MPDYHKVELWRLLSTFLLAIVVAVVWYYADLYPDSIPETRAELVEAIASAVVIGINILLFIIVATVARRPLPSVSDVARPTTKQFNTAEHLTQVYLNFHGNIMVAITAIVCITLVSMQRIPLPPVPGEPTVMPVFTATPTQALVSTTAPIPTAIPSPTSTHEVLATVQSESPAPLILTAEGFGRPSDDANTFAHRRQTALQAAKIIGTAELAKQLAGVEIAALTITRDFQVVENEIRQIIHTWLPAPEVLSERYDDATGDAFVKVQLVLTEEKLQQIRQKYPRVD